MNIDCLPKFFFSTILMICLVSGCTTIPTLPTQDQLNAANYGSYPSNYNSSITNYMSNLLFDPYSAVYRFSLPYKGYAYINGTSKPPVFGYIVIVGINAKNRMGGYTGEKGEVFFFKDDEFWRIEFSAWGRTQDTPDKEPTVEKPSEGTSDNNNPQQAIDGAIIQFSGSGIKNTRPFNVNGPWELQWDAKGGYFGVFIKNADGSLDCVAANQQGAGKGSSYQPKGGHYYLTINAVGNWHVKVIEVK